jgi:ferric-dicitrate binding protein FerR (iron transport regulator)
MLARDGRDSDDGENKYAVAAARLLMDQQPQGDILPLPQDRQRDAVVAAMALAIAGRSRRKRVVIASALTFAAAAGVALAIGLAWRPSTALVVDQVSGQGNMLVHMASTQSLADRQKLQPGDSVRSGDGGTASFGFANGTRLALTPASDLRIDEVGPTRRFFLFSGGVHARVSKLGRGERFVVDTPDSEVEVRGTVFAVGINPPSAACAGAATSKVEVSEGTVWVRSGEQQVVLRAGESWSTPCPRQQVADAPFVAPAEHPSIASPGPAAASVRSAARKSSTSRPTVLAPPIEHVAPEVDRVVPPPAVLSRLAEQNDLFSAAMAAERQGQHAAALRKLDELIARFPGGPLSESARGERQRILSVSH